MTSLFSVFLIGAILFIASQSAYAQKKRIPRWSVYEIKLHAKNNYENPFMQANVTATFTGPGKTKKTIEGFWNGGDTFLIRFTPTMPGKWYYQTSSKDPGLNDKTGYFICSKANTDVHGFRRRDKDHPYHFIYDDGTYYFLFGTTYYAIISNVKDHGSWKKAINGIHKVGINKVRFKTCFIHGNKHGAHYPASSPYGETHDQLNINHFKIIDTIVQYLLQKQITADLILFSSGSRNFGTLQQDEKYVQYMIHRYAAYPNVTWCLSNEWNYTGKDKDYWNRLGMIIRKEDPWINNNGDLRMLSTHQQTRIDFQFFDASWPTYTCIQYGVRNKGYKKTDKNEWKPSGGTMYHHGDEWGNAGILFNWGHNMPVVNDEYGYAGEPADKSAGDNVPLTRKKHRQIMWGIYIAGGYGSTGDKHFYKEPPGRPYFSADWHYIAEYGDIKNLIDFFKKIPYWEMSSQNSIVKSGNRVYVLSKPDNEYVIYVANGGDFSVALPSENFIAELYDPRTGNEKFLKNVTGTKEVLFTTPKNKDWVIYIKIKKQ